MTEPYPLAVGAWSYDGRWRLDRLPEHLGDLADRIAIDRVEQKARANASLQGIERRQQVRVGVVGPRLVRG